MLLGDILTSHALVWALDPSAPSAAGGVPRVSGEREQAFDVHWENTTRKDEDASAVGGILGFHV